MENKNMCNGCAGGGVSSGIYGLAVIGAAAYGVGQATTFWMGVLGVLKALVWPAMVMYKVFEVLHL